MNQGTARSVLRSAAASLRDRFTVDTRSLAAFRIGLGLLLLVDLALRARDLTAFYTDNGVLPRTALISQFGEPWQWSLHLVHGSAAAQAVLFTAAGVAAVALTVGYRTRLATVVSWLLLVSLHHRNPVVLNGGDDLLGLLLFWSMFLPLGARWAVDSRSGASGDSVVSVATAALLLQPVMMYTVNAVMKMQGEAWLDGGALAAILSLEQFTVRLGPVLAQHRSVLMPFLHVLDLLWVAMLAGAALLVLLPRHLRTPLLGLYVGGHLFMAGIMRLGLFPFIAIVALLPFLPDTFWRRLPPRTAAVRRWWAAVLERLDAVTADRTPAAPQARRVLWYGGQAVVLVFLVLSLLWNVQSVSLNGSTADTVPDHMEWVVDTTRTDQYWIMFAPDPLRVDGWYVVPARLSDGQRVDLLHGGDVSFQKPQNVAAAYPNERWRKYLLNLWRENYAGHRPYFAAYLCDRWERRHATGVQNLTLYFMEQETHLNETEPVERVELWSGSCPRD
ncbi:MAG: HTTM domain-containing protein [Candidatus Nanohaloarchaea archaeon]|nr:HTTM domain-containing protein [Candidatus Nanohaloarchaea archaeon]